MGQRTNAQAVRGSLTLAVAHPQTGPYSLLLNQILCASIDFRTRLLRPPQETAAGDESQWARVRVTNTYITAGFDDSRPFPQGRFPVVLILARPQRPEPLPMATARLAGDRPQQRGGTAAGGRSGGRILGISVYIVGDAAALVEDSQS